MDVLEVIKDRRSIRRFKDIPIPKDILGDILEAGRFAPMAGNVQNCRFIVVEDEDLKAAVADACFSQTWMKTAPVFLVIVADYDKIQALYGVRGERLYGVQNAAAIVQNMLIMATAHGLGSCWVSAFDEKKISDLLRVSPAYRPQAVIPLGYPAEKVPTPERLNLYALTRFNYFDRKVMEDSIMTMKEYATVIKKDSKDTAKEVGGLFKEVYHKVKRKLKKKDESLEKSSEKK